MEKFVKPYDKVCMRMAMLKHEETFREQVYELHRLYQIQKMLMKNMARGLQNSNTHFDLPAVPRPSGEIVVDESEIELTLGPRRRKVPDVTPLTTSDSMPSFSSSSTGSSRHEVVPAGATSKTNPNSFLTHGRNKMISSSDDHIVQQEQLRVNQPAPWLYHQVLSLNMTT